MDSEKNSQLITEMDTIDEDIELQRQKIVKLKLSFTTMKNNVAYALCDEMSSIKAVQETVEAMLTVQEAVIDTMSALSLACSERKMLSLMREVSEDMEKLYSESHEIQDAVCKFMLQIHENRQPNRSSDGSLKDKDYCKAEHGYDVRNHEIDKLRNQIADFESRIQHQQFPSYNQNCVDVRSDLWNQLQRVSIPVFSVIRTHMKGGKQHL